MKERIINNDGVARKLVLAADDAPKILFFGAALKGAGHNFMGTASGAELLGLSLGVVPRLILLDVEMPGMNGFETCRRLRANTDLQRAPIAFLTGRKTFEDVTEGLGAGGNDFILKLFEPSQLLERVHHWTNRLVAAEGRAASPRDGARPYPSIGRTAASSTSSMRRPPVRLAILVDHHRATPSTNSRCGATLRASASSACRHCRRVRAAPRRMFSKDQNSARGTPPVARARACSAHRRPLLLPGARRSRARRRRRSSGRSPPDAARARRAAAAPPRRPRARRRRPWPAPRRVPASARAARNGWRSPAWTASAPWRARRSGRR